MKIERKEKENREWTLLCTGSTLIFLRVSRTRCVLDKRDPGMGVRPGAEINGSTSRTTRWCPASVLRLWDAACSSRRSIRSPHREPFTEPPVECRGGELRGRDEVERLGLTPPFILSGIQMASLLRRSSPRRWCATLRPTCQVEILVQRGDIASNPLDPPKSRWNILKYVHTTTSNVM